MTQVTNIGSQVDLVLRQGADFATSLTFSNPDSTPVDLTSCTLAASLRRDTDEPSQVVTPFVVTITNAVQGKATLALPAASSAALACGESVSDTLSQFVWDLKFTDSLGNVSSPLFGNVQIFRGITQ